MSDIYLEDTAYFRFCTIDATGAAVDADSLPTVDVEEDGGSAAAMGASVADIGTGLYRVTVPVTVANGYETGKRYNVMVHATVDSISSSKPVAEFMALAQQTTPGTVKADLNLWRGSQPQGLSTNGYLQSMILRWLTDDAGGTPNALDNGDVRADVRQWIGTAVATPTTAGVPEIDVTHWNGAAVATPTVAGVPEVDVTHYGGNLSPTNINGVPQVDVSYVRASLVNVLIGGRVDAIVGALATDAISAASVSTAAVEKIRDGILNYAYRSGRTVRGLFRRLGAALELVTGLKGTTTTYKQPDGSTTEFSVTQDIANGTRTAVVVTNSEVP